jgi:hypothetical protein
MMASVVKKGASRRLDQSSHSQNARFEILRRGACENTRWMVAGPVDTIDVELHQRWKGTHWPKEKATLECQLSDTCEDEIMFSWDYKRHTI